MAHMTNDEVGCRIGLTYSGVSRLRNGHRTASLKVLQALHREFDLSYEDLIDAAVLVGEGDRTRWVQMLDSAFVADEVHA